MKLLYSLTFILLSSLALAQPGGLDKTYNADFGLNSQSPKTQDTPVNVSGQQSDGSLIVVGRFGDDQGYQAHIRRFKPDGTPDPNFTSTLIPVYPSDIAIQDDDKIVLVGTGGPSIMRLNANGTIDQAFQTMIGTGATAATGTDLGLIYSVAIDADGKILVGGLFERFNGITRVRLARLNADGSLDTTFNPGEGSDSVISAIGIQSTGKIIIAGVFTKYDGSDHKGIARVNTDGSIDGTFNPGGFNDTGMPEKIVVMPDDKLFIGGQITNYSSVSTDHLYVIKTDANGVLDTNFLSPIEISGYCYDVDIYDEDNIIVVGGFQIPGQRIIKMNINTGAVDQTFKPYSVNSTISTAEVMPDGSVVIGGGFNRVCGTIRNGLARLLPDGNLEGGRGADNTINAIAEIGSGAIVVGGDFTGFRGIVRNRLAQVTADGNLNDHLKPEAGANGTVMAIAKDASGKYVIAGNFTQYRGVTRNRIARINDDGTLDNTFDPGAGANATVRTIVIQSNGMILIGGDFTTYDGATYNHIVRIETDGDADGTFDPNDAADGNVQSIALQSDGKIIATGNFNNFDNNSAKKIARLSTLGAFDATFDIGSGADGTIYSVKVDGDDNLVIGGGFTAFDGNDRKGVARLTSDGALDESFDLGDANYTTVRTITVMANGNIFVGGDFTNKVALLNSEGETDTEWYPSEVPDGTVFTSIEVNGKIIIGGQFTTYDFTGADRLARINNEGQRAQIITFPSTGAQYAGATSTLLATASSGLTVTYKVDDDTRATIDGDKITYHKTGPIKITAMQAGDEKWDVAPEVSRDITVSKGPQTIIFDVEYGTEVTGNVGDELDLSTFAHSSAGLTPLVFISSAPNIASVSEDGSKLILQATGETFLSATHGGNVDFDATPTGTNSAYISLRVLIDVPTGLEDEAKLLVAYPNPTDGVLTVQLPSTHTGPVDASILNTLGISLTQQVGQNVKFDMSSFPSGIYILKVKSGKLNAVKRIYRK